MMEGKNMPLFLPFCTQGPLWLFYESQFLLLATQEECFKIMGEVVIRKKEQSSEAYHQFSGFVGKFQDNL
jgi:hypothetical protein